MISAASLRQRLSGNRKPGDPFQPFLMKKKHILFGLLMFAVSFLQAQDSTVIQDNPVTKPRVAIFAPLYLDSAFDANNEYRYAKNNFPKFFNSGLEFYEGAQLALDSLSLEGAEVDVYIYDTRSASESLQQQLAKPELDNVSLVIAHCSYNEVRALSDFALKKKIPVINATVPNDVGTTGNPYFVLLNPTLRTQCEGIYRFIQKYYPLEPLVVFRRKGTADDAIKSQFDEYAKQTRSVPLKLKYVDLPSTFTAAHLKQYLDSTKTTVCIAGSLDMNFGKNLALQLASISKTYPIVIMGMPTWDGIREFSRPEYKGPEIIYSTPFHNSGNDKVSQGITEYFNTTMYARPSDMVFRGYAATWKFVKLLLKHGEELESNLSSKDENLFTEYDIQPVLNRSNMSLDYFENKKLYFLKWKDGLINVMHL